MYISTISACLLAISHGALAAPGASLGSRAAVRRMDDQQSNSQYSGDYSGMYGETYDKKEQEADKYLKDKVYTAMFAIDFGANGSVKYMQLVKKNQKVSFRLLIFGARPGLTPNFRAGTKKRRCARRRCRKRILTRLWS